MNRSDIFIILRLARPFIKFESKITAFLNTHLLFAWDAGTKQLIGCKRIMGFVRFTLVELAMFENFFLLAFLSFLVHSWLHAEHNNSDNRLLLYV